MAGDDDDRRQERPRDDWTGQVTNCSGERQYDSARERPGGDEPGRRSRPDKHQRRNSRRDRCEHGEDTG